MVCRHCKIRKMYKPRGLCYSCYNSPVRDFYPPETTRGNHSWCLSRKRLAVPAEPTFARPGSPEKIEVMQERAARGEAVFHPEDRSIREGLRFSA
jgi:hypothetical protein